MGTRDELHDVADVREADPLQHATRRLLRVHDEAGCPAAYGVVPARAHERAVGAPSARLGQGDAPRQEEAVLARERAGPRDGLAVDVREPFAVEPRLRALRPPAAFEHLDPKPVLLVALDAPHLDAVDGRRLAVDRKRRDVRGERWILVAAAALAQRVVEVWPGRPDDPRARRLRDDLVEHVHGVQT